MSFKRRRSDRPDPAHRGLGSSLERLEGRELLSTTRVQPFSQWLAVSDLPIFNPISHQPIKNSITRFEAQATVNPNSSFLGNEGKVVTGLDRLGNEYTITVHGPGTVIVTDTTPNDGVLDDNINTIQLINTNPKTTYVTGSVVASEKATPNAKNPQIGAALGTVLFNQLIDTQGVKSIDLNGFTLEQTVPYIPGGANTGIFLWGGVGRLQFHNIDFSTNPAVSGANATPSYSIVIGDPSTPLPTTDQPIIKLDEIFNTVLGTLPNPAVPQTAPTVNILINGVAHGIDFISASGNPQTFSNPNDATTGVPVSAGNQFNYPVVGVTGRTQIQALGINNLDVKGAVNNVTISRSSTPFQNGFSGVSKINKAVFEGPTDALGIDATDGKIGSLTFEKGAGNPNGLVTGSAATYGFPVSQKGYAVSGFYGALVTAKHIGSVKVDTNDVIKQTSSNPDYQQVLGEPVYYPRKGTALVSSAIVTSKSIDSVSVSGNPVNSEIKTGFHYPSFEDGLEGTRAPSHIGNLKVRGDLVNSDISATVRPGNFVYGSPTQVKGPGKITGKVTGTAYNTGVTTPLGNTGAGVFARTKIGKLPPPNPPARNAQGILLP
jgi:hypothetical protein